MSGIGRGRTVAAAGAAAAVALGVVLVAAAAPVAAADNATFKLPAHIIIETNPIPEPEYPSACAGYVFAEFPHIRGAVSYAVTLDDTQFWYDGTKAGAPPFADDDFRYGDSRWVAPAGSHRFALSGGSTSSGGCEQVILGLEGRWMITDAKVSMSETFTERWEKPAMECRYDTITSVHEPVVIGRRGGTFLLRRFGGDAFLLGEDGVKQRLHNEIRSGSVVVEVGPKSLVRVTDFLDRRGHAIAIGPGTKVRLTPGKPIKILETTPGMGLGSVPKRYSLPFLRRPVRTNSCVLAVRG